MRVLFEKLTRMIRVLRYLFDVLPNPFVVGFVPFIPRVLLCSPFFFFFLQFLTVFLDFSPLCETKLFLHCSIVWHIDLGVHSGDAGGKRLHWYPWCKLFGSSFVLLDVFLRLVGVFFFFLRALFPATCYNSTCFFFLFGSFSLYHPIGIYTEQKKKRARVGILVLLHLHVRGVLFSWIQLWNSHLFSVCGRGVRLSGWLTGSSALLCGRLIVLIAYLHTLSLLSIS